MGQLEAQYMPDLSMVSEEALTTTGASQSESGTGSTLSFERKDQLVQASKRLLLIVLFIFAILLSASTYFVLKYEEQSDFEQKFHDFAIEIAELVHMEARDTFISVENFANTITSYALFADESWPLVTLPHFEPRGIEANLESYALMTAFSPLVMNAKQKSYWEKYSVKHQRWIQEGVDHNIEMHLEFIPEGTFKADPISPFVFRFDGEEVVEENSEGPYLPAWQMAPAPHDDSIINYNLLSNPTFSLVYSGLLHTGQPVLSEVTDLDFFYGGSIHDDVTHPHSFMLQPVFKDLNKIHDIERDVVGLVISILSWDNFFKNLLPEEVNGMIVVLEDTCNQTFTYEINGMVADYLGPGDLHDKDYDDLAYVTDFATFYTVESTSTREHCEFFLNIYPSKKLEESQKSNKALMYTIVVFLLFCFTSIAFFLYDYSTSLRDRKLVLVAKRTNTIVTALFPTNVRDRLLEEHEQKEKLKAEANGKRGMFTSTPTAKSRLMNFVDGGGLDNAGENMPIADLFPDATVLFADIAGFTAWSSVREPSQVFQLLETLYHSFDEAAKKRKVFKVETIGDCYVAVAGLPERRKDHAIIMSRFAKDILTKMSDLSKKLEVSLGPDTGDLCLRIGLNSGPVTAGVLRGEKARFQLFGDTVNTAARMESNGKRERIHISQTTADLLIEAGKDHWISAREDKISAKGKGEMQTYWLEVKSKFEYEQDLLCSKGFKQTLQVVKEQQQSEEVATEPESFQDEVQPEPTQQQNAKPVLSDKIERLVSWNSDVLLRLIKQIVARRNAQGRNASFMSVDNLTLKRVEGQMVLDEVEEIIAMPRFDAKADKNQEYHQSIIEISSDVELQLRDYITIIATMYQDNPFHNFEHASHVTMSVVKLLSRIVAPDADEFLDEGDHSHGESQHQDQILHDHTYGITSSPLTQFAVVFAALIHDVDHPGVPNAQLIKENSTIAKIYKNKSVAEQNSVDIAWDLLMHDSFKDLRSALCSDQAELKFFRQLVVNTVMATDIVDKELKDLRNNRWAKAFQQRDNFLETDRVEDVNRKATIVIEHLIQASDVAHTMQHWHIYRKWNERFYQELLHAYKTGRAEKDPTEFWYKGEIGFFDFYIIPLAKKLKECGVFGVSSDEYLNYAMVNRNEWERKGEEVVAEMAAKYRGTDFSYNEDQCKLGDAEKKNDENEQGK